VVRKEIQRKNNKMRCGWKTNGLNVSDGKQLGLNMVQEANNYIVQVQGGGRSKFFVGRAGGRREDMEASRFGQG